MHLSKTAPARCAPRLVGTAILLVAALVVSLLATTADAQTNRPDEPSDITLQSGTTEGAQPAPGLGEDLDQDRGTPVDLTGSSDLLDARVFGTPTKELAITEVMANPQVVYDSLGEWFEIYNPYNRAVDLDGWIIGDLGYDEHVINNGGPLIIDAGGYLVMGNNGDQATNGGVRVDYSYGQAMQLFNASDAVILQRARGDVASRVAWDDGLSFPSTDGESMSLRNVWDDDEIGANWCLSTSQFGAGDLGTPGVANECTRPAQIVITEIMHNPNAVADSVGEWFEVMNLGSGPVDLGGWTISDDDTDLHVITASTLVAPGERVVLGVVADASLNGGVDVAYAYGSDISLDNGWDELVLTDPAGLRSVRIRWDDGQTFPDPTGATMSVIDPTVAIDTAENWCTAGSPFGAGDLGSPGLASDCSPAAAQGPALIITEIMRDPEHVSDTIGEWFEVYNPNDFPVDLQGWIIRDHDTNYHVIGDSVAVAPRGYAVLGRDATNPGPTHAYVYDNVVMHNGNDQLVLANPTGTTVDQVSWNNDEFPAVPGASMALRSVHVNNDAGESWCVSSTAFGAGDFGTPGTVNECELLTSGATLVISEVMANPYNTYDSAGEWFELHNTGPLAINLSGFVLKDEGFNEFTIDTSLIVEPNSYVVFARVAVPALNGGVEADYEYGTNMVLINDGDEIVLLDPTRTIVDRVAWGTNTALVVPSGASLQLVDPALVDPALDNASPDAWCQALISMASGDAGTPTQATNCDADPGDENYIPEYDHVRCSRANPRAIVGTDGDDVLIGTSGSDVIIALRGNDRIESGSGKDIICAGPGADIIDAGSGNDIILGGSGADVIDAGFGNDWVYGGRGNDIVDGGTGSDSISLGPGDDQVDAGSGNDVVTGNDGDDVIDGGTGLDTCAQGLTLVRCES